MSQEKIKKEHVALVSGHKEGKIERSVAPSEKSQLTLDVAVAAVFGAISLVFSSYITPLIPRIQGWGIAFFDPVSLIWIIAFLLFGFRAGMLTTIIGAFGLLPFDPTGWAGPVMKFSATLWMILVPYLFVSAKNKSADNLSGGEKIKPLLENKKLYISASAVALVIRIIVMIVLNYVFLKYYWGVLDYASLDWLGIEGSTGIKAMIITVILLNLIQGIGDLFIPYLLVISTPLKEYRR